MAEEVNIQELVVRLTADMKQYNAELKRTQQATIEHTAVIEQMLDKAVGKVERSVANLNTQMRVAQKEVKQVANASATYDAELTRINRQLQRNIITQAEADAQSKKATQSWMGNSKRAQRLALQANKVIEGTRSKSMQWARAQADLNAMLRKGLISAKTYAKAFDQLKQEFDESAIAAKRFAEEGKRLQHKWQTPLNALQAELKQVKAQFLAGNMGPIEYGHALSTLNGQIRKIMNSYDGMESDLSRTSYLLEDVQNETQQYTEKLRALKRLVDSNTISQEQYNRSLSRLRKEAPTVTGKIMKMAASVTSFGGAIKRQGRELIWFVSVPLLMLGAAVTRTFLQFDEAMSKSTAIMLDVGPKMQKEMAALALAVSGDTLIAPAEVAESYFFLGSAGFTARESMEHLGFTAKFATAANFEMGEAVSLLTDAMAALGMKTGTAAEQLENMTRVADVLVKANTLADASTRQFAKALTSKAAAALRLANKSIEEGVAVLAAFAEQGIKGELAGEKLSIVMRDLQRTALKFPDTFKQFNVTVFDTEGRMLSMQSILQQLEGRFEGLEVAQKRSMLMMMGFQDRSVTALMTLIGFSAEVGYFQEVLENANGTVMTVFERRMQAISSKLTAAWHEVKGLAGSFGEALVPVLERAIDAMKAMAKWFNGLSTNTQQWIVTLFAAAVALGPIVYLAGLVIQGLGGMVMAVGYMIKGFQIFTKVAMAATASQWAFVASAAALLALGYYGAQAWPSMRKYNEELKKSIALNKKLNDREQKKQSGVIEEIEKIKNPVEKLKRVNDELDMANKNLSGIRVQLGLNRQAAEEYADSLVSDTFSRFAGNKVLEDFEMERQNLLKREAYYQEHAERLLEIQGKSKAQIEKIMKEAAESGKNPHKGLVDPELFEQQQEGVRDTIDALEQQQRELTMTERDLLKYKMAAIEAGDAATEYALSLYDANKALEKQQAAQKAADETAASMLEELAFFGKTAAEIAILKAEMSGLVDQKTIDKMKEYNKALIGMKAHKKLMKEGAAVTEKFKSEGQKASERAQKLVEMFHKGAISGQTFVKAMRDLHEQFREDFVAKFKSTGTEALRADSAEGELAAMDQLQMQQANKAYRELSNSHIMGAVAKYEKAQGLKPGEVSSRLGRQQPKKQAPPRKRKKNELPTGPGTGFANTEMTEALKAIRENTGRPPIVVQEAGFETV